MIALAGLLSFAVGVFVNDWYFLRLLATFVLVGEAAEVWRTA